MKTTSQLKIDLNEATHNLKLLRSKYEFEQLLFLKKYIQIPDLYAKNTPDEFEQLHKITLKIGSKTLKLAISVLFKVSHKSNKFKYYNVQFVRDKKVEKFFKDATEAYQLEIESIKKQLKQAVNESIVAIDPKQLKKADSRLLFDLLPYVRNKKELTDTIEQLEKFKGFNIYPLWYASAIQYVSKRLAKAGGKRYYKSERNLAGSIYYQFPNNQKVRISDHELPDSERREYNRSIGIGGNWHELVLDQTFTFDELELLTDELIDVATTG